jgi:tetratricopeptide (TPR) repeat protein
MEQGEFESAKAAFEEGLRIRKTLGDSHLEASSLTNLGEACALLGEATRARTLLDEALAIFQRQGRPRGVAHVTHWLGVLAAGSGDFDSARRYFEESIASRRDLRDQRGTADSLASLGFLLLDAGKLDEAREKLVESFAIHREIGVRRGQAQCLEALGNVASIEDPLAAARMWGSAEKLREDIGAKLVSRELLRQEKFISAAQSRCDSEAFARSWAEGRSLSADKAFGARPAERETSSEPSHA